MIFISSLVERQRSKRDELKKQGWFFIGTFDSHDAFRTASRSGKIPVGSRHLWAINEVWAPKQNSKE